MHQRRNRLALAIGLAVSAVCATGASAQPPAQTVLLLFSDEGRLPATTAIHEAVEARLAGVPNVSLVSQFLDVTTFGGSAHEADMAAFLAARYARRRVDVLITAGPPAAAFARRHGDAIWPDARYVDVNYLHEFAREPESSSPAVRVPLDMDIRGTAEAALRLLPATRRIALVGGAGGSDRNYLALARSALAPLSARVTIEEIAGLSIDSTRQRLAGLGDDTIVIVAAVFEDADGRSFIPADAVELLAASSRRPIFGAFGSWLGRGVVGGHVIDFEAVGRQVAAVTLDLLSGAPPPELQPATRWVFDARSLERWGLDEGLLPAGSHVSFREPGIWTRYRWWALSAAGVVAMQAFVISALLFERRRRQRAARELATSEAARVRTEAEMQMHLHELAHVNVLAAIGHSAAVVAHELNQPLTSVLSNAQALQMLLRRQGPPNETALEILDDIISEDKRAGDIIQRMRRMLKKEVFAWTPVDLNSIVEDVARIISHEASHVGVRLLAELSPDLPAVRGDRVQLQHVLLNLVQNGVQASAARRSAAPVVRIETRRNGGELTVSITDSGDGIAGETQSNLFAPFFTTKTNGLGLGLSISRTIVEQHGGAIAVANVPGGGAEFSVRLPAALEPAA